MAAQQTEIILTDIGIWMGVAELESATPRQMPRMIFGCTADGNHSDSHWHLDGRCGTGISNAQANAQNDFWLHSRRKSF